MRSGASATIANLPAATYLLGGLAPLILSLIVPNRLDRAVVIWSNGITAFFVGTVCITLLVKLPPCVTVTAVVVQGLFQGIFQQIAEVFTYQCLNRGFTLTGRKRTFTVASIFAIIGSLGSVYLGSRFSFCTISLRLCTALPDWILTLSWHHLSQFLSSGRGTGKTQNSSFPVPRCADSLLRPSAFSRTLEIPWGN